MATQPSGTPAQTTPRPGADYPTALAAVQAGHADGISYILTKDDPFAAIDLDHCRTSHHIFDRRMGAKLSRQSAAIPIRRRRQVGAGCRIWGLANGAELHRKFTLEIDGKPIAAELFRRTNKALTITGYTLDPAIHELTNIDQVFNWAVVWGERRKAAAATARVNDGNGFDGSGCRYTIDQIEQIVRDGLRRRRPQRCIPHDCRPLRRLWLGRGRILAHLQQFPEGIGGRYLREDRLDRRSTGAPANMPSRSCRCRQVTAAGGWEAKAPQRPEHIRNRRRRRSRRTSIRSLKR